MAKPYRQGFCRDSPALREAGPWFWCQRVGCGQVTCSASSVAAAFASGAPSRSVVSAVSAVSGAGRPFRARARARWEEQALRRMTIGGSVRDKWVHLSPSFALKLIFEVAMP